MICDALSLDIADLININKETISNTESNLVHGYSLASKGIRFLANISKLLIFFTLIILLLLIYKVITKNHFNIEFFKNIEFTITYSLTLGGVFYPIFKGNLGHKLFDLKVISSETGEDYCKASDGVIREFLKYMLSYTIIPMIWILWDEKNQNLYDKLTKTFVVKKN